MSNDVIIRTASVQDAAALLRIYAPYVLETAITYEYAVPDEVEFAARIAKTLEKYPYLVAETDGRPAGYAYAGTFIGRAASDWAVETSIYIDRSHRCAGVGGKLYRTLEEILRMQNILNLNAAIACSKDDNDPYVSSNSVDFHAHLGYTVVGQFDRCGYKFGRWYDLVWMEKHIGEHGSAPLPVRRFDEVRDEAAERLGICL